MEGFMQSTELMLACAANLISKLGLLPHCDEHTLFLAKCYAELTFFYNKIENIRELLDMVDGQEEVERDQMIIVLNREFTKFFQITGNNYSNYLNNINSFMSLIGDLDFSDQIEYLDAATTVQLALADLRAFVTGGNIIESPEQLAELITKE